MKTAIYNGKLITPAEVLENKVLDVGNDRIIDILAEDVIDLGNMMKNRCARKVCLPRFYRYSF